MITSRRRKATKHSANTHRPTLTSNTSSIARFPPGFQFSLGTLSALASARGKTCLLLAVLEVDGLDEVTVRRHGGGNDRYSSSNPRATASCVDIPSTWFFQMGL